MAGTGDLDLLRLCRRLRARVGAAYGHVIYGSHMAISMAIGLLLIGGGRWVLALHCYATTSVVVDTTCMLLLMLRIDTHWATVRRRLRPCWQHSFPSCQFTATTTVTTSKPSVTSTCLQRNRVWWHLATLTRTKSVTSRYTLRWRCVCVVTHVIVKSHWILNFESIQLYLKWTMWDDVVCRILSIILGSVLMWWHRVSCLNCLLSKRYSCNVCLTTLKSYLSNKAVLCTIVCTALVRWLCLVRAIGRWVSPMTRTGQGLSKLAQNIHVF